MMTPGRLDLLLVNPAYGVQTYQHLSSKLSAVEPPVWAGLLANAARKQGLSVRILDAEAEGFDAEQSAVAASEWDPLLIAVVIYGHNPSASTQTMPGAGAFCRAMKKRNLQTKILMIGGHVSALPETTLREEAVDFVCAGEGPATLYALVQALKSASPDFDQVPDLWFWKNKKAVQTPPAPLIQNLDVELPGLAWDLLPMEKYRAHNWHCFGGLKRAPYAALYTTLGCPYHCQFCCIQAPFRSGEQALGMNSKVSSYRFWSPAFVLSQIDLLVQHYGVRNFKIADEMFVLNKKHVTAICDLLIERNYDLNIWAYARVDTVEAGMIPKLRKAGFRWLAFGIEAAGENVREDIQKNFSQRQIFETIRQVRESGIYVIANYIFGLPEDDSASMQATLDLAKELNTEFANFYCTMAYPGSPLYEKALQSGLTLPSHWDGYSQYSETSLPLATRNLSAAEVLQFRDKAFRLYYDRPEYRAMLTARFGLQANEELELMLQKPLHRKILSSAPKFQ